MTEPEGAGKAADPPQVDRHVDPGAQSQVWRADDVLVDISPGDWIAPALPSFDYTVGSLAPPAFTLYSRILHPAKRLVRGTGVRIPVRWAEVAEFTGGVIHQTVEWGSLLHAGIRRGVGDGRGTLWDESPGTGEMPQDRYAALAEVLVEHTTTPDSCWFGFWDGRVSGMRLPDSVPPCIFRVVTTSLFTVGCVMRCGLSDRAGRTCGGHRTAVGSLSPRSTRCLPMSDRPPLPRWR